MALSGGLAAVSMAGSAMSAYGKIRAGSEADKMFNRNAQIAEIQAQDAIARGKIEEKKARRVTEQVIGAQRVGLAAQGVDVNRGSALDVQADAAYLGELDVLTIRNNAAKEAWGFRTQADDLRYRGKVAKQEGWSGAANTILAGSTSILLSKYGGMGGMGGGGTPRSTAVPLEFNPATAGR